MDNNTNNYDDYGYDGQDDVDNDQGIGVKTVLTMTTKVPQYQQQKLFSLSFDVNLACKFSFPMGFIMNWNRGSVSREIELKSVK